MDNRNKIKDNSSYSSYSSYSSSSSSSRSYSLTFKQKDNTGGNNTSTYLQIASSLVSPSSFLRQQQQPSQYSDTNRSLQQTSQTRTRNMDKAYHPSSFQQLEKVLVFLLLSVSLFFFFFFSNANS